ncbi:MAG TPA: AAA family ATPase [Oscillospiraceae bacterium]|nr:AAA family ATPase [Oscillospiraceae bacterium]
MPNGIVVFGANGCGKTTLGCELARKLNIKHLDVEDYYFKESEIPYSKPRSKDTVIELMLVDIEKCDSFVLSAVTGDYGDKIGSMYKLGVFLSVPADIRLERVERRSLEQYGERVLVGGDMYEQDQEFIEFVRTRNHSIIDKWVKTLACPILHLDGTKAISENIQLIIERYNRIK